MKIFEWFFRALIAQLGRNTANGNYSTYCINPIINNPFDIRRCHKPTVNLLLWILFILMFPLGEIIAIGTCFYYIYNKKVTVRYKDFKKCYQNGKFIGHTWYTHNKKVLKSLFEKEDIDTFHKKCKIVIIVGIVKAILESCLYCF